VTDNAEIRLDLQAEHGWVYLVNHDAYSVASAWFPKQDLLDLAEAIWQKYGAPDCDCKGGCRDE